MKNGLTSYWICHFFGLFLTIFVFSSTAQTFDLDQWNKEQKLVSNHKISPISDGSKKGVSLSGIAWLKNAEFSSGVIEVDLRGRDIVGASFVGIAFHGRDTLNYDVVYFRPFNFRSPDSVRRIHAVQYMSIPKYEWNVLREQFPGKYEKAVVPAPPAADWFHAKIEVKGKKIKVYVNDSKVPSLEVEKLNDLNDGLVGLWSSATESDFANLKIVR